MCEEIDTETRQKIEEFKVLPCTLPNFRWEVSGFASDADATNVWTSVHGYLFIFGRLMNLEKLHHVSISYDYAGALAKVDQGTGRGKVLKATQDEFATGVAMAAPIFVDSVPRIHLVIFAGIIAPLADENSPDFGSARYTLAHECGHIHDLAMQDKAFPEIILQSHLSEREGILHEIAEACWSEYAACRLSANWAHANLTSDLETTFCSHLDGLRVRGRAALLEYQMHKDIGRLLNYLRSQYGDAMKYASYLLGHLRGLDEQLAEAAPKAAALIQKKVFFKLVFARLESCLDSMWESYEEWTGFEVFSPLREIADEMLKVAGVTLETQANGRLYVHVSRNVTYVSTDDE